MDALLDYARRMSKASKMAAPRVIESDTGRTFYWGKGEASVKVYQKDLERVADGKLAVEDADPHLVRVEFRFSPKSDKKAGAAGLARNGAWRLLGTVHWVRSMVEQIAALIGVEGGTMAVQRVIKAPDARTVEDKAAYGLEQYARTFCRAAASASWPKSSTRTGWRPKCRPRKSGPPCWTWWPSIWTCTAPRTRS